MDCVFARELVRISRGRFLLIGQETVCAFPTCFWLHLPLDLNNSGFLDRSILLTKIIDPAVQISYPGFLSLHYKVPEDTNVFPVEIQYPENPENIIKLKLTSSM